MTYEQILALSLFALATSITPGPNNLMLLSSGATYGFRRSIPHILGIGFGFVSLVLLVGAGLGRIFEEVPQSRLVLQGFAALYLTWLAYRIAAATTDLNGQPRGRPLPFLQAAAFQWVNPKGWAMALTANAVYSTGTSFGTTLAIGLVFGAINVPSVCFWALLGHKVRILLKRPAHLRAFNVALALLLLASLYPLLTA